MKNKNQTILAMEQNRMKVTLCWLSGFDGVFKLRADSSSAIESVYFIRVVFKNKQE